MSEWFPIESAPKDGTRILGLTVEGVFVMSWIEEQPLSDCARAVMYAGWLSEGGATVPGSNIALPDGHDDQQNPPTHWMPLPAPPSDHIDAQAGGIGIK